MNKNTCLSGIWQYRIGKGEWTRRAVPFSASPVGHSECQTRFDLPIESEKTFLRFDGVTYYAKAWLNGTLVGEMLPYCEYKFDVSKLVAPRDNALLVEIEDISPEFGPSAGWGNYGGITRDVWLEQKGENYIEDVYFSSSLSCDYLDATYRVEVKTARGGKVQVTLLDGEVAVDEFVMDGNTVSVDREVAKVKLWSTDSPNLYTLRASLLDNGEEDLYSCSVGFREFKCSRHRFTLNGKDVFLQGVCRHEIVGDYGHTVPVEVIEKELARIKSEGCNFVRLVHYPHRKETLEIADRLGLMVSEEPGLWWSDTANPRVSEGSLSVLEKTIMRDRNHASIVFWLCFNECRFTEQFLLDAVAVCRRLDCTRLVSGANCMSDEDTYKYYNICNFDFYTMHPYHPSMERAFRSAEVLFDKPLMFTEWGGYFVYDNPHLISDFIADMYSMYEKNEDGCALAGASFWYWAEVDDFGRGGPACVDGVLKEALVDKNGNRTMIYEPFFKVWREAKAKSDYDQTYEYKLVGEKIDKTALKCYAAPDCEALRQKAGRRALLNLETERYRKIVKGPVLMRDEVEGISKIPYIVTDDGLAFEGDVVSDGITVLGAVSLGKGYPIAGEYGEAVLKMIVEYEDGANEQFVLRNGIEITTAFSSLSSSKINPRAEKSKRFAEFSYEKNFENYIINRLDVELVRKNRVRRVLFYNLNKEYDALVYGVYA